MASNRRCTTKRGLLVLSLLLLSAASSGFDGVRRGKDDANKDQAEELKRGRKVTGENNFGFQKIFFPVAF